MGDLVRVVGEPVHVVGDLVHVVGDLVHVVGDLVHNVPGIGNFIRKSGNNEELIDLSQKPEKTPKIGTKSLCAHSNL